MAIAGQFHHFYVGNTSTQSGSIFQPAMLVKTWGFFFGPNLTITKHVRYRKPIQAVMENGFMYQEPKDSKHSPTVFPGFRTVGTPSTQTKTSSALILKPRVRTRKNMKNGFPGEEKIHPGKLACRSLKRWPFQKRSSPPTVLFSGDMLAFGGVPLMEIVIFRFHSKFLMGYHKMP